MDAWFVLALLVVMAVLVAVCESVVFVVVRRAFRRARPNWRLPRLLWLIFILGHSMIGAGAVLLALTAPLVYGPAVEGDSASRVATTVVSTVGWAGVGAGALLLLIWLVGASRATGGSQDASGGITLFGRSRGRAAFDVLTALVTSGAVGIIVGIAAHSWTIAFGVGIPLAVVLLSTSLLTAHAASRKA